MFVGCIFAPLIVSRLVNRHLEKFPAMSDVRAAGRIFLRVCIGKLVLWPLLLFCTGVLADIRETPHNLIKSRDKSVSEKLVCVFCHTPVQEVGDIPQGSAGTMAPRWQKSVVDGFVFTIYDDIGRLGLGKPSVGSQSVACLSCHDTNQAFSVGRTSADHPFGVPYRGAIGYNDSNLGTAKKADPAAPFRIAQHLTALEDFRAVSQGTVEGRTVFWVSRSGVTNRRTRGDLPLYGRGNISDPNLAEGLIVPHIECGSCHDPHASTATFLRVSAEGSQLCLTCHDK